MYNIFKSKYDRAVTATGDFITQMIAPLGKPSISILSDPYCLGFLQIVGIHIAAQILKSSPHQKPAMAFEDALKTIAPMYASEAGELLSVIQSESSVGNEAYLRGRKDGDTYMGYQLHRLAPQRVSDISACETDLAV